jgi:hypothetical protein
MTAAAASARAMFVLTSRARSPHRGGSPVTPPRAARRHPAIAALTSPTADTFAAYVLMAGLSLTPDDERDEADQRCDHGRTRGSADPQDQQGPRQRGREHPGIDTGPI